MTTKSYGFPLSIIPASYERRHPPVGRVHPRTLLSCFDAVKPLKAPPAVFDIGDLDRNYAVVRELGRGGMGAVFLARHREAGHRVAIKIASTEKFDAEAIARFSREARLMARFRHPNIVRLYDVRQIGSGRVAIVMEYVRGVSLARMLHERQGLPFATCTGILVDLGKALAHAHEHGVVHRDVKPPNVLVDEESGAAKLSDFGIAKVASDEAEVTAVGSVVGTPAYMSPEQIDGREIDGRSDIYGLGVLGWEIVTGSHPWAGEALYHLLFKQKHEALPAVSTLRPDTPPSLVLALEGALEKDPAHRWASVGDMVAQLASDEPTPAMLERRKRRAASISSRGRQPSPDAATIPVPRRPARPAPPASAPSAHSETMPNVTAAPGRAAEEGVVDPRPEPAQAARRPWRTLLPLGAAAVVGGVLVLLISRSVVSSPEERSPAGALTQGALVALPATSVRPPTAAAVADFRRTGRSRPVAPRHAPNAPVREVSLASASSASRQLQQQVATAAVMVEDTAARSTSSAVTLLDRRADAYALAARARVLAYAGQEDRARHMVDSALSVDALSGSAYSVRARLRIRTGDVRDAWTDIELASRTGARWEALALTTMLKARELGAAEARARLTPELRAALIPQRLLDPERAVALAVALAQVGDTATALTMLERAPAGDSRLTQLLSDPLLAPLRSSRRFAQLLRKTTAD